MFGIPSMCCRAHAQAPSSSTTRTESPRNAAASSTSETAGRTSSDSVLSSGRFAMISSTVAPPAASGRRSRPAS
eukprot:9496375-Pyramimonas_sp.AAC.1